ncbi:hypothetical protein EIM50_18135 [Pseudoxanthomonas sp. SGD-10]|nr:hypothetical protein EIM50_18135 [Pseudoxanthomonas sp. SGD-10]
MRNLASYVMIIFALVVLGACSSEQPKEIVKEKEVLPQPFKRLDKIEVKPGLSFDVLNWGKGPDSLSAVLILRSDTIRNSYTSYNLEIEGFYKEVFNTDLDTDGNPEIIIYTTANDKYSSANFYCLEYNSDEPSRIRFPELSSKTKKQYKGGDRVYIHSGKLRREFDLYDDLENQTAKPVGKKVVEYTLRGNQFDISEIKD